MSKTNKVMITAALCGAGTKRNQTPYVPQQPDEIANDALECVKAGASIIHIHGRDKDGNNFMNIHVFEEIHDRIKETFEKNGVDAVLNFTSSGSKFSEDDRIAYIEKYAPEMCSYDPLSMNWANSYIFSNPPAYLERLGKLCIENGTKPEIEIFNGGDIGSALGLAKKGFLAAPIHFQFVLGVTGGMDGGLDTLAWMLPKLPADSTWSISGIGKWHMPCMLAGLSAGCDGLRVGLEDNIFYSKGVLATNAQLVERAAKLVVDTGREVATAADARTILGIKNHW